MQNIINYDDKVALYENSDIADINKVSASDMNEIKSIVNGSLQGTNAMGSIVVDDVNGKNLFDKTTIVAGDYIGANSTIRLSSRQAIPVTAGETYTVSSDIDTSIYNYVVSVLPGIPPRSSYDETQNTGWISSSSITLTITTSGYLVISVRKANNSTLSVSDIASANFQLEKGSTATEYTPYKKIIKEENGYVKENTTFYADDFKCKNLYNDSTKQTNKWLNSNGTISGSADNNIVSAFIKVENGKQYTFSGISSTFTLRVCSYTSTSTDTFKTCLINNVNNIKTFTADADYIVFAIGSGDATSLTSIQLEIGSEASPYTEYKNFENEDIYSTNEMVIGRWIDGKPLYRKSVVIDPLVYSTTNQEYAIMTISNLKDVVEFNGVLWNSSRTYLHQLPYYNNGNITKVFYKTDGKIYFQSSDTWSNSKVIATVTYTKTTD